MSVVTYHTDDTDAFTDVPVTSSDGSNVDWSSPVVAIDGGAFDVACTWQGDPATTRNLRVPIGAELAALTAGRAHAVTLKVPNGRDLPLYQFWLSER